MKKIRPPSIPLIAENGKAENGKLALFLKKWTTHPRVYPFGLHSTPVGIGWMIK